MLKRISSLFLILAGVAMTGAANAIDVIHPGGFPHPIGPVASEITWLYNILFIIIAVIALVVAVPVLYILWKYRRDKVSRPATFSHSTILELIWTIVPAVICLVIAILSYRGMILLRNMPDNAMNVEAVAYQFGWDFYYPDVSVADKHVAVPEATTNDPEVSLPGAPRQTKVLVIPVGRPIVMHVTGQDVIHAFFVPHLGVKIDAIPGRINYTWFEATEPGNWLGQCAELCGQAHGEMFFRVKAVPQAEFDTYIAEQKKAAGIVDGVSGTAVSATEVSGSEVSGSAIPGTDLASPTAPVKIKAKSIALKVAEAVSGTAGVTPTAPTSPTEVSGGIIVPTASVAK